jgi:hypothetical protein
MAGFRMERCSLILWFLYLAPKYAKQ